MLKVLYYLDILKKRIETKFVVVKSVFIHSEYDSVEFRTNSFWNILLYNMIW